jgi:hypothetical protein
VLVRVLHVGDSTWNDGIQHVGAGRELRTGQT